MADQSLDPNFNKYGYYDSLDNLKSWDPSSRDELEDTITNYLTQIGVFSEPYQARYQARQIMGDPQASDILSRIGYVDAMAGLAGTAGVPAFLAGLPAYLMAEDAYKAFERGNLKEGALNTGFAVLESLPMAGPVGDFVRNLRQKLPDSEVGSMLGERLENSMRSMGALADITEPTKQAKPTAKTDELGFYSALEEAGLNLNRKKGNGQSFMNDLLKSPNVKQDELDESGLTEFLAGKNNVTREEVQDFISNNRIQVEEVRLGDSFKPLPESIERGRRSNNRFALFDTQSDNAQDWLDYYPQLKDYFDEGQGLRPDEIRNVIANDEDLYLQFLSDVRNTILSQNQYDPELVAKLESDIYAVENQPGFSTASEVVLSTLARVFTRDAGIEEFDPTYVGPPAFARDGLVIEGPRSNDREILLRLPTREKAPEGLSYALALGKNFPYQGSGPIPIFAKTREEAIEQAKAAGLDESAVVKNEGINNNFGNFYKGHYDRNPSNVLAHIRVNDRVDSEGNRILFIEEIQSDWHGLGKKKGYGPNTKKTAYAYMDRNDGSPVEEISNTIADTPEEAFDKLMEMPELIDYAKEKGFELKIGEINELDYAYIPDAPFKENWYNLAIKRILKYAADNGYKRIGMTTAKQQEDRYDLTRVIDRIESDHINNDYGSYYVGSNKDLLIGGKAVHVVPVGEDEAMTFLVSKDGKILETHSTPSQIETQVKGQNLSSVIGSDLADKIMDSKESLFFNEQDLKVGGKGMRQWYDNTYIETLNKLGKKYKTKVKKGSLENVNESPLREHLNVHGFYEGTPREIYKNILYVYDGERPRWLSEKDFDQLRTMSDWGEELPPPDQIHVFDIPEEMRESLSGETSRQPLYSFGGGAGIGALSAFDEDDQILPVGP